MEKKYTLASMVTKIKWLSDENQKQLQKSAQKYAFFSAKDIPYCFEGSATIAYYNLQTIAITQQWVEVRFRYGILKILIDILASII